MIPAYLAELRSHLAGLRPLFLFLGQDGKCLFLGPKDKHKTCIRSLYRDFFSDSCKHVYYLFAKTRAEIDGLAVETLLKNRGSPCVYTSTSYEYDCVDREGKCVYRSLTCRGPQGF